MICFLGSGSCVAFHTPTLGDITESWRELDSRSFQNFC
jgi:hypothetical protein